MAKNRVSKILIGLLFVTDRWKRGALADNQPAGDHDVG